MKILGLDISSTSTGYCIISNNRLLKSSIGVISPPSKKTHGERLLFFEQELSKLLKKHKPDAVVIEDIFRGPNVKTFKVLSMYRGVCFKIVFEKTGYDPYCIMPTEARKLVGAHGVKKEDGFEFVINKYAFKDYKFKTHNDITDAIVLALAYGVIRKKKR